MSDHSRSSLCRAAGVCCFAGDCCGVSGKETPSLIGAGGSEGLSADFLCLEGVEGLRTERAALLEREMKLGTTEESAEARRWRLRLPELPFCSTVLPSACLTVPSDASANWLWDLIQLLRTCAAESRLCEDKVGQQVRVTTKFLSSLPCTQTRHTARYTLCTLESRMQRSTSLQCAGTNSSPRLFHVS